LTSVFLRATLEARIEEVSVPKSDLSIEGEYAPVADRIALFYERFPEGRIVTHLTMHNEREIAFRASVYRTERSRMPAATGWASERIGDGDINTVACLENTETSAIGRALANLGFTASKNRPSAEEMAKAARARARRGRQSADTPASVEQRADLDALVRAAERHGLRARRAAWIRHRVAHGALSAGQVTRLARTLRRWVVNDASFLVEAARRHGVER
jgi:hypothetical protein